MIGSCCVVLLGHCPGLQLIAIFVEFGAGLQQQIFQLSRVGVGTRGQLFAANTRVGAVDDAQAEGAIAIVPGHALEGLESTVCDQKSFVDAERGVHVGLLSNAHSSECRRLGEPDGELLVLMLDGGVRVTC